MLLKAAWFGRERDDAAAGGSVGFSGGVSLRAANASARVTMSLARWRNQEALPRLQR